MKFILFILLNISSSIAIAHSGHGVDELASHHVFEFGIALLIIVSMAIRRWYS